MKILNLNSRFVPCFKFICYYFLFISITLTFKKRKKKRKRNRCYNLYIFVLYCIDYVSVKKVKFNEKSSTMVIINYRIYTI